MSLLAGVESALAETDQALLLRMVGADAGQDLETYRRWSARGPRGRGACCSTSPSTTRVRRCSTSSAWCSCCTAIARHIAPGRVLLYDAQADAALLVAHLAALGHRGLLHVTGPLDLEHEQGRDGGRAVRSRARDAVLFAASDYTHRGRRADRRRAAGRAIRRSPRVITSNDLLALGARPRCPRSGATTLPSSAGTTRCSAGWARGRSRHSTRFPEEQGRRSTQLLLDNLQGLPPAHTHAREATRRAGDERPRLADYRGLVMDVLQAP